MRDLILAALLIYPMVMALRHPWIGVLGWTWVSIMNPHAFSWLLKDKPVAAAMAGAVMLGVLLTKDKRSFFISRESGVLIAFMVWMCITLPFSFYLDASLPLWSRIMKIDFMILVAMVVLYSRKHIEALTWILVLSLAFYGVKGGIFTILTGGSYRVWGPEGTYIDGNNELAIALIMAIPLMRFLQQQATNKWVKRGLLMSMVLCAVAAIGSQSRGALLALGAMGVVLWWRGKHKLQVGLLFVVLAVALVIFMPASWTDRMHSIKTYEQDGSAMGRINAWWMAFNLAKSNLFGGGFMIYNPPVFAKFAPDPTDVHAAHSIYFMVLGEQGFIGLFLFLLIWALVWNKAGKLVREGRKLPQTQWLSDLGGMCQVSLVGYAVGGAFLSLSYYDLPYNLLILVVVAWRWYERKGWIEEEREAAATAAALKAKQGRVALT